MVIVWVLRSALGPNELTHAECWDREQVGLEQRKCCMWNGGQMDRSR